MNTHRFFIILAFCGNALPLVGESQPETTVTTDSTQPTSGEQKLKARKTLSWTKTMLLAGKKLCKKSSTTESLRIMPSPLKDLFCGVALYVEACQERKELFQTPEQKN